MRDPVELTAEESLHPPDDDHWDLRRRSWSRILSPLVDPRYGPMQSTVRKRRCGRTVGAISSPVREERASTERGVRVTRSHERHPAQGVLNAGSA